MSVYYPWTVCTTFRFSLLLSYFCCCCCSRCCVGGGVRVWSGVVSAGGVVRLVFMFGIYLSINLLFAGRVSCYAEFLIIVFIPCKKFRSLCGGRHKSHIQSNQCTWFKQQQKTYCFFTLYEAAFTPCRMLQGRQQSHAVTKRTAWCRVLQTWTIEKTPSSTHLLYTCLLRSVNNTNNDKLLFSPVLFQAESPDTHTCV